MGMRLKAGKRSAVVVAVVLVSFVVAARDVRVVRTLLKGYILSASVASLTLLEILSK